MKLTIFMFDVWLTRKQFFIEKLFIARTVERFCHSNQLIGFFKSNDKLLFFFNHSNFRLQLKKKISKGLNNSFCLRHHKTKNNRFKYRLFCSVNCNDERSIFFSPRLIIDFIIYIYV